MDVSGPVGPSAATRRTLLRVAAMTPLLAACSSSDGGSEGASSAATSSGTPSATPSASPSASPSATSSVSPSSSAPAPATPTTDPRPRVAGTVVGGLSVPWGITFLPDGSALVGERDTAKVLRVASGRARSLGTVPGVVSTVDSGGEGGLLGLALHPGGRWLYAYHSTGSGNQVVRMALRTSGASGSLGDPEVVLSGIDASIHHNGGGLRFGSDGLLFVSTGDAEDRSSAPDTGSLNGKVLRITDAGGSPRSNPFGNPVWSYGHRNVEGLAFDGEGRLWASEFGDKAYDELNHIVRGGDYGWPDVEGRDGSGGYRDPLAQWSTDECSPSGIAIVGDHAFLGALRGECLWSVSLRTGRSRRWLEGHGRIRLVAAAPDGSLWVGTSNRDGRGSGVADQILRVTL